MMKELLMQSKWRVFNIHIAKSIGLHEALVLMEIADAEYLFEEKGFFLTYEDISDNTTLSVKQIRNAVINLKKLGIIETKMVGMPAKQQYILKGLDLPKMDRSRPAKKDRSYLLNNYKEQINKEHINTDLPKSQNKEEYDYLNIHQQIPDYVSEFYTDKQARERTLLLAEEMLNSKTWMAAVARQMNRSPEFVNKKVKEFLREIEVGHECFGTLSSTKKHFSKWLKYNKEINN